MSNANRCTSSCGDSAEDSDRHTHVKGCRFAGRQFPKYTHSEADKLVAEERERCARIAEGERDNVTTDDAAFRRGHGFACQMVAAAIRRKGDKS